MKPSTQNYDVLPILTFESKNRPNARTISGNTLRGLYTMTLIANDLVMMVLAYRLAFMIRFDFSLSFFRPVDTSLSTYTSLVLLLTPVWLVIFAAAGLYRHQNLLGGTEEYARTFRASSTGLLLMIVAGFLDPTFIIARGWLLLFWAFSFLFTAFGRFCLRRVIYQLRQHGYFLAPTVVIGANNEGLLLARQLLNWRTSGLDVLGFIDKKFLPGTQLFGNLRVLGSMDQLEEIIKTYKVEELVLASSAFSCRDHLLEIFKRHGISIGVNLRMSSGLYEIITTGLTVKEFAYVPLVGVNKVRLTGIDRVLKFLLDYCITIPLLILISPVLMLIAVAVKLDSPGPAIHRRRVKGVNNREFNAFKFRTMYVNGDEILSRYPELQAKLEQNHKLKHDPRITRLGRFLRKFSLDELPQLLNVLRLEMSLVGPRMISPEEMQDYDKWGMNLLTVRPGITGLWQVSGRSNVPYEERIRMDMHYIRNWNIWMDLQLIFQTIPAVLKGRGAY